MCFVHVFDAALLFGLSSVKFTSSSVSNDIACQSIQWKHCKSFKGIQFKALDVQFGVSRDNLKMVSAFLS